MAEIYIFSSKGVKQVKPFDTIFDEDTSDDLPFPPETTME